MKKPLIINRPDLQPWQQKAAFAVVTALFWLMWVYLWLPLITLAGWVFFGYQFHLHMILLEGYTGFLRTLAVYACVIAVMGGALLVWAKYNHLRFRDTDRRKPTPPPTLQDLAVFHARSVDELAAWRSEAVVTVHHDAHGRILRVQASPSTVQRVKSPSVESWPAQPAPPPVLTAN